MITNVAATCRRVLIGAGAGAMLIMATPIAAQAAVSQSDLSVTVSGPSTVAPGAAITYRVTVTNGGPDASTDWTLVDALPFGVTRIATSTAGCTVLANVVSCRQGALPAHGSVAIVITAVAPSRISGSLSNRAVVIGRGADPAPRNNVAVHTAGPAPQGDLINPAVGLATGGAVALAALVGGTRRRRRGSKAAG